MPHGIKKRLHRTSTQQKAMAFPEMQHFWCESVTEQNLVKNRKQTAHYNYLQDHRVENGSFSLTEKYASQSNIYC